MLATIKSNNTSFTIDLLTPLDISIVLTDTPSNPLAWYIGKPDISPVKLGDWVGKVSQGAAVNFNNISFNPHAHGTHTECLGHITNTFYSVNDALSTFFFYSRNNNHYSYINWRRSCAEVGGHFKETTEHKCSGCCYKNPA